MTPLTPLRPKRRRCTFETHCRCVKQKQWLCAALIVYYVTYIPYGRTFAP